MSFQPGTHLRVRRYGIYDHHGIYVSDDCVIAFSGEPLHKADALVRPVSLQCFQKTGAAKVVKHPGEGRPFGLQWLPNPLDSDEIVARAKYLSENCPPGRYSLIGVNCEHVANWCVSGYFESLQSRKTFLRVSLGIILVAFMLVWKGIRLPAWLVALSALSAIGPYKYNSDPYRLFKDVINRWPGYEKQSNPAENTVGN